MTLYITHKSPQRKGFSLFIVNLVGISNRNRHISFGYIKVLNNSNMARNVSKNMMVSKKNMASKNNMVRYILSQVMFQ